MKKLYLKGRVVIEAGLMSTEVHLSKKILSDKANRHVTLNPGWYVLGEAPCNQPKPDPPIGRIGDYVCVGGQWIWFDA